MNPVIAQRLAVIVAIGSVTLASACSSPPSRLYMLNSVIAPSQVASADVGTGIAATAMPASALVGPGTLLGVSVTVPEYLDRLDIVERTSGNELKPDYSAQWAENLAVTATRAVAEDLGALLPTANIVMLPSRASRDIDYQINLDLTTFESDSAGVSTIAGRWSIIDTTGAERASGRVLRTERAEPGNYAQMAAAMSRDLAGASTDIANALVKLQLPSARRNPADR